MKYAAYQASKNKWEDFSFTGRDESAGILGTFIDADASPVVIADTLEELRHRARAHLGKEPSVLLYLTDTDGRVYESMINEKYHKNLARVNNRFDITFALLVFCVTGLLATTFGYAGRLPLLGVAGAGAFYGIILRSGFLNEVEGALICEILLVIGLIMLTRF